MKHGYDPETKQMLSQWKSPNSPRPKKARQVRRNVKSMLIVFFDVQGIVHKEFVPLVQPLMESFTVRFWGACRRAFGANVQTSGRKTIGFSTMKTRPLTRHRCSTNPDFQKHYSDSPPLLFAWYRPLRLFPIPQDEITDERRRFGTPEEIHAETQEVIDTHTFENFHGCTKSWEIRWNRCIHA